MSVMTDDQQTGGMIALIPRADDAAKLVVSGGDRAEDMHLTLTYLGDDVSDMDAQARVLAVNAAGSAAAQLAPVAAEVMGFGSFNPTGGPDGDRKPCATYLVGDSAVLGPLRSALVPYAVAEQHEPFMPHVTAGYGIPVTRLSYTGPIVFDRVRVALGEQVLDFPLGDPEEIKRIMDDVETKGKMPPQFAANAAKKKDGAKSDDKGGTADAGINNIGDLAKAVKAYKAAKPDGKAALWPKIKAAASKLNATKMLSGLEPPPKDNGTDKKLFEVLELEFKVTSQDPRAIKLREMWAHTPKLTKMWKPGTPGDFKRLVRALREHTDIPARMIKGFAANVHHLALGAWPGREGRKAAFDWLDEMETKGVARTAAPELPSGQELFEQYKAARGALDEALGGEEDPEDIADGGADEATEDDPGDAGVSPEDAYGQALSADIDWQLEGDGSLDDPEAEPELDSPSQPGENSGEEEPDDGQGDEEDLNDIDDLFALARR